MLAEESPARTPNEGVVCAKTIVDKAREQMSRILFLIESGNVFFSRSSEWKENSGMGLIKG
jgi:hypothetical protein